MKVLLIGPALLLFGLCHLSQAEKCMCKGSGDPHYYTYDKQVIHFQGPCKYTLSKSIDQNSSCSFNVEVKNEHRNSKKKVTYVKWVDVYIYGLKIRLMKNNKFQVNGINRFLPFAYQKDKLKIFTSGLSLQLVTECGIEVIFYNNHLAKIVVPPTFSGNMTGLCGNCDGKKNDFKTKNGADVRSNRNKFNLIGDSYRIPDESDSLEKTCKPSNPSECSAEEERNVVKNEFCGLLTDRTGPFKKCIESFPNQAEEAFASCKYDVCSVNAKPGDVTVCQALESFVKTCKESGIDVVWRNKTFCQSRCGYYGGCHPDAHCTRGVHPPRCVCNHGYGGDGVTVCDADTCGCVASGDPHYVSFDGDSFYLLYDCKYSLSRVKSGVPGCDVKVEVKNERRPYSLHPHRTFTRLVDVYHGGHVFRMSLYKKVFRDNTPLKLPYADSSGTLSIALSGPYMKLETSCGLKVRFDGVHKAIVSLPLKLGKSALGICGNCDSDKSNDLKLLSGGRDLNAMANRTAAYEIFAQQFVVPDNSDTPSSDPRCAP